MESLARYVSSVGYNIYDKNLHKQNAGVTTHARYMLAALHTLSELPSMYI